MIKTYILDTNVLLSDSNALFSFEENNVVLPLIVIEELDRHKDRQDEVGRNARETARKLSELIKDHSNVQENPIPLGSGGKLFILSSLNFSNFSIPPELDAGSGDNQIIAFCKAFQKEIPNLILVTRDLLLRIKAEGIGITCQDYKKYNVATSANTLYNGVKSLVGQYDIDNLYVNNKVKASEFLSAEDCQSLFPNQFLVVKQEGTDRSVLARYTGSDVQVINGYNPCKIEGRNKEQKFAIDLLLDPSIKLTTIVGSAGTGKSLLAIAAGLHLVLDAKKYKSLVVCRPIQPVGKDIGYLPGPQPMYSKVLTPAGWLTMGEVTPGIQVISRDGNPSTVLDVFPKGLKEILKVTFEDGSQVECCEDHPWNTFKPHEKQTTTRSTKEIEADLLKGAEHHRHFIDFVQLVNYKTIDKQLPVNPYIFGALLGDGCWTQDYALELSSGDAEIIERIKQSLPSVLTLRQKHHYTWSFVMKQNIGRKHRLLNMLIGQIKSLGVWGTNSHTKFIPEIYLYSSIENRVQLLQGLMDTNGYVSADGSDVSLTTCSQRLAEDFKALVLSLGGYANIKYSASKHAYTISVSFWKNIIPFSLLRKVNRYKQRKLVRRRRLVSVERTGTYTEMKCILIENPEHLYITDGFVVTHNTLEEKMEPWIAPIKDNLRFLLSVDGKKSKRGEETLEMLFDNGTIEVEAMTFIRGRSIANAYMIIDEAQNLNVHELKTIITRVGEGTKIVLTGDIEQIDNMYVDSVNNGLTVAIEKFKDYIIAGHVTLTKGERSELATIAASIL